MILFYLALLNQPLQENSTIISFRSLGGIPKKSKSTNSFNTPFLCFICSFLNSSLWLTSSVFNSLKMNSSIITSTPSFFNSFASSISFLILFASALTWLSHLLFFIDQWFHSQSTTILCQLFEEFRFMFLQKLFKLVDLCMDFRHRQ